MYAIRSYYVEVICKIEEISLEENPILNNEAILISDSVKSRITSYNVCYTKLLRSTPRLLSSS